MSASNSAQWSRSLMLPFHRLWKRSRQLLWTNAVPLLKPRMQRLLVSHFLLMITFLLLQP